MYFVYFPPFPRLRNNIQSSDTFQFLSLIWKFFRERLVSSMTSSISASVIFTVTVFSEPILSVVLHRSPGAVKGEPELCLLLIGFSLRRVCTFRFFFIQFCLKKLEYLGTNTFCVSLLLLWLLVRISVNSTDEICL